MLHIRQIEHNPEAIQQKIDSRFLASPPPTLQEILKKNKQKRALKKKFDDTAHTLNQEAKKIASLLQQGKTQDLPTHKQAIATRKKEQKATAQALKACEKQLQAMLASLPNPPHQSVPIGKSPQDNRILQTWTSPHPVAKDPLPHWEILKKYKLVDFERGSKVSGAGFPFYCRKGAQLQRSLVNYFLDQALAQGYQEHQVPFLVQEHAAFGTGQLPDKEGQMYALKQPSLYLIPTAEVPLTNLLRDTTLPQKTLPLKLVAHSPCFRREAGSWGSHVRGLNRLHQFDKVEIVQIVHPEQSPQAFHQMCQHVQHLLIQLGLTHRIVALCTGDLGFAAAKTHDFEVWSPGQKKWLEVSSVSAFHDYQAHRINLRYTTQTKPNFCYTLNGSALALPRILAALLEHHQTPQQIRLPKALHPYLPFQVIE